MGPLLPPVLLILAALSTTNCVTMQTVSTTMATTSPSITTPSPRVATSSDNMTTKTTKFVTTPTGKMESETVPLTVYIDNGETLFRPVGSDATITCSVSGSGTISIVWIGPVGNILTSNTKYTVTSYDINTGKSTLTIFALSTTDSGSYTCRATDVSVSAVQDSITLTAYGTTSPGMTTGKTTSKQETPASATATHTLIGTTSNNQTVLQRLVSTTVPLTVSIDNGETLFRPVGSDATITCSVSGSGTISIVWIGPVGNILTSNTKYTVTSYDINTGKSTLTIFALSTTDNGSYTCRATDVSVSAVQDSITLTAYGTTSSGLTPDMTTSKQDMITTAPATTTSTHNMIPTVSNNQTAIQTLVSTKGTTLQTMATTSPHMTTPVLEMTTPIKNTVALMSSIATTTNVHTIKPTTGTSLPTMPTGQSNIATAAQVSTTSTNTMTPVPITPKTTSQKTDLATGIPEQSSTCCFNENMVIMLQKNVPVVNGYVPFVSILEETNGTDVSVCDTKVLLKAAFKRSNQTVPCQGCTSVPQCGNQMLKIDLWMSPNKTGFSFHVGDSKTNDGYGGDDSTQENDAEFHFYNLEQRLYGSDKCSNMSEFLMGLPNTTTHWVTIYIGNEFIRVSNPLGYSYELCSNCLFALNGQSDSQGTVNQDIYIGLNRIIRNSYFGDGSGVCGAVISWACPWKT